MHFGKYGRLYCMIGSAAALLLGAASVFAAAALPLRIADAWLRQPPPGAPATAAYMTLHNDGKEPLVVTGVAIDGAGRAEIHETRAEAKGGMSMHRLDKVTIPAGGTVTLAPGGMHVMVFDLKRAPVKGATVGVTLSLADGREVHAQLTARAQ